MKKIFTFIIIMFVCGSIYAGDTGRKGTTGAEELLMFQKPVTLPLN